jgi:hypothetical protein
VEEEMTATADQTLDERALTPTTETHSPFLPNTKIQYAWDSTSLGLLKTCPRLYQYTMIDGWQPRGENIHLRFGLEYHSALEHYDRLTAQGSDREEAIHLVVRRLMENIWDWHTDPETKAGRYKNRETLLSLVVDYLDHFHPDPATTYILSNGAPAVELSFRFELGFGPKAADYRRCIEADSAGNTYEEGSRQPYLLAGHLDRIVEFNSQLLVMDRKTTTTTLGAHYFAQYEPNNQMTLYTLAGRTILNTPIRGVIIDAAQILLEKPNAFARGFTYRTDDQLSEWLDDLQFTLTIAEAYATAEHWPMNDTACDKYGGCRFREICTKSPNVRERFLASDFDKLPEDQRWNPLKSR